LTRQSSDRCADDIFAPAPDAYDNRPNAWAAAMQALAEDLPTRFAAARLLREVFAGYTWRDSIDALVAVADSRYDNRVTVQDSGGRIAVRQAE
jgi:hypothetical protein